MLFIFLWLLGKVFFKGYGESKKWIFDLGWLFGVDMGWYFMLGYDY